MAKNLGIASSTVHNIIKRFKESLYARDEAEKQYQMAMVFGPSGGTALKTVVEITAWTQKHFQKPLSVNTIHHCIHK